VGILLRKYFIFSRNLIKDPSGISGGTIGNFYSSKYRKEGGKPAGSAAIKILGNFLSTGPQYRHCSKNKILIRLCLIKVRLAGLDL